MGYFGEIYFLGGGFFWGDKKIRGPLEKSQEMAHYLWILPPKKTKIISRIFRIRDTSVFLCLFVTICPQFYILNR